MVCFTSQQRAERKAAAWAARLPQRPPDEEVDARREEIASFDALVGAFETFGEEIAASAAQFAAAPASLLKHLERSCGEDSKGAPEAWRQLYPQLSSQLGKCAEGLNSGQRHIQAIKYLIEQSHAQSSEVHEAFAARDEAWLPKAKCDERAADLRKRFGPNLLLGERKARLQAKHLADLEFQTKTAEASKAADDMLSRRFAMTGAMLWEVCHFYKSAFREAEKMLRGFTDIANILAPPPATEALLVPADSVIAQTAGLPGVSSMLEGVKPIFPWLN